MNQEKVGQFIKDIRKKNNLTQKELATMLNVTHQAVSKWERGINVPDIAIIIDISKQFNIDVSEILTGEKKDKIKKINITYIILIVLIIISLIYLYFIINNKSTFEFKTISSDCDDFLVTGSAAYNKDKSSIYISNITYCRNPNDIKYNKLECNLYEDNKLIRTCEVGHELTLQEYLKDVRISVNDYKATCKNLEGANLYLEINAYDKNNETTTYKIPINLDNDCAIQP